MKEGDLRYTREGLQSVVVSKDRTRRFTQQTRRNGKSCKLQYIVRLFRLKPNNKEMTVQQVNESKYTNHR